MKFLSLVFLSSAGLTLCAVNQPVLNTPNSLKKELFELGSFKDVRCKPFSTNIYFIEDGLSEAEGSGYTYKTGYNPKNGPSFCLIVRHKEPRMLYGGSTTQITPGTYTVKSWFMEDDCKEVPACGDNVDFFAYVFEQNSNVNETLKEYAEQYENKGFLEKLFAHIKQFISSLF